VREAARQLGTEFVVAGATARDIVLWHAYGIRAERATRDVDVAVCAISWKAHGELIARLLATGLFKADTRIEHSLTFEDDKVGKPIPLDLVPVVALPAFVLLKILAWRDRRTSKNTDASDLLLSLRSYYKAGNEERIWEAAADLLAAHGFDLDLASTALLGRDARRIALPATLRAVLSLLEDENTYDTLRRDMLARAAVQMFDEFAEDSDKTLAAFRNAFLLSPSVHP